MENVFKSDRSNPMTVTVQGHKVTLYFSSEPNTQVAAQVREALLGMYLLKKQ